MKKKNLLKTYESSWTGGKDGCKLRPEAAAGSDILYLFSQENLIFIKGESGKW